MVTLGGSSVRNVGPDAHNWPWQLGQLLPEVEIVNLASPGQTMRSLTSLMEDLALLTPDLIVIYSGHNDVAEAVFTGRVGSQRSWTLPIWKLLGSSWLAFYLTFEPRPELVDPNRRAGLAFASSDVVLRLHPRQQRAYDEDLRAALEAAPAPVLLTTLLRNFEQGPQGLLSSDPACREQASNTPLHQPDPAGELADRLEASCGETALGLWLRAHEADEAGRHDEAVALWHASLALDPYPLRATAETDEVLRSVAADTETALFDLEQELGRFPPAEWFMDSLHPTALGAEAIARALLPEVERRIGP